MIFLSAASIPSFVTLGPFSIVKPSLLIVTALLPPSLICKPSLVNLVASLAPSLIVTPFVSILVSPVVTVVAVTVSTVMSFFNSTLTAPSSTDVLIFVSSPLTLTVSPRAFFTDWPSSASRPKPLDLRLSTASCNWPPFTASLLSFATLPS